jgi:hypothetical protein
VCECLNCNSCCYVVTLQSCHMGGRCLWVHLLFLGPWTMLVYGLRICFAVNLQSTVLCPLSPEQLIRYFDRQFLELIAQSSAIISPICYFFFKLDPMHIYYMMTYKIELKPKETPSTSTRTNQLNLKFQTQRNSFHFPNLLKALPMYTGRDVMDFNPPWGLPTLKKPAVGPYILEKSCWFSLSPLTSTMASQLRGHYL